MSDYIQCYILSLLSRYLFTIMIGCLWPCTCTEQYAVPYICTCTQCTCTYIVCNVVLYMSVHYQHSFIDLIILVTKFYCTVYLRCIRTVHVQCTCTLYMNMYMYMCYTVYILYLYIHVQYMYCTCISVFLTQLTYMYMYMSCTVSDNLHAVWGPESKLVTCQVVSFQALFWSFKD